MKRLLLLLLLSIACHAQQSATTLSIGLFTTQTVEAITLQPIGSAAWQQTCPACPHTALQNTHRATLSQGHLHFDGNSVATLQLGGTLRLQPDAATPPITVSGIVTITPTAKGLRAILQMPSERYVAAVLNGEAAPDEPSASLEALAIAARTFALANLHRHQAEGFDLCDSTHCQSLRLSTIRPQIEQAVRNTAGETLWFHHQRAHIYYTQHCGGTAEAASSLWPNERAPYLIAHPDPFCLRRAPATWHTDIPLAKLQDIAHDQHWQLPDPITGIRIIQRTNGGRAKLLELFGLSGRTTLSASSLHFAINRTLGWNQLRSDNYTITLTNNTLHLEGRGYGHGAGLCQAGAFQMALENHTARDILATYFPGTHIGITPSDQGWQQQQAQDLTLRSTSNDNALFQTALKAWQQARTLYPPAGTPPTPTIYLAPTTEIFRQLTASPGWLLAVTRGSTIYLQPASILRRNPQDTLLHEFLHVLIESESTAITPLWLREGLAEALTDPTNTHPALSLQQTEQILASPPTHAAAQQAHTAAAQYVRQLGRHYSLTVMRQWLHTGLPPQALANLH